MELQSDEAQVEARFGPFGDSANLMQERCTVCTACTIGSQIVFDVHDGTARRDGSCQSLFQTIWR
jgi:hypothetical protein